SRRRNGPFLPSRRTSWLLRTAQRAQADNRRYWRYRTMPRPALSRMRDRRHWRERCREDFSAGAYPARNDPWLGHLDAYTIENQCQRLRASNLLAVKGGSAHSSQHGGLNDLSVMKQI